MTEEIESGNPNLAPISTKASMFSFKISEDFVQAYTSKKSPFGYTDAGVTVLAK